MNTTTSIKPMAILLSAVCSAVIAGCGGGGGTSFEANSANGANPANMANAGNADVSVGMNAPSLEVSTLGVLGAVITDLKIQNTGAVTQTNVPVTFGQTFTQGHVTASESLAGKLNDGTIVPLQVDVKATHADGSVRHAIISAVVPSMAAGEAQTIRLMRATAVPASSTVSPKELIDDGFASNVNITLDGQIYNASADAFLKSGKFTSWLAGHVVNEWMVSAPLKTAAGVEHPHLTARFAIRSYAGQNKARVDVTIENNWAYEPGPQNFTYNVEVNLGGKSVYSKSALTHFHHSRWRKTFWWGAAPETHVSHNITYLIGSKAVPNYDTSITVSPAALNSWNTKWSAARTEPMAPGVVTTAMPTTGGRPDIGPLPAWAAIYVLSMDNGAKNITLGAGDLAGSWPIHYRDKKTDRPVSLIDYPYMTLLGRPGDAINRATGKSELFPACAADCSTAPYNYSPDSSHQPSMAYLPYLVTGDYYYLEELQFWANWNGITANPYYRDFSKGLLRSDQVRGQAWSLRTLGQAAFITPDKDPMKQYFVDHVNHNLDWYNATYTYANANQLGVIDGSGQYAGSTAVVYTTPAGEKTGIAPWQDDFFTWSVGYLAELDFSKAKPVLEWKAKFPVGRMTAPGYCWIDGAAYSLAIRPNATSPAYGTFKQAYEATFRASDGSPMVNSTGARYIDQSCGSQAQADWRTQFDKDNGTRRTPWAAGEMTGYAYEVAGYPSNMQPALAVAATSGIPNAKRAWEIFMARSVKPTYNIAPQWAIVPR